MCEMVQKLVNTSLFSFQDLKLSSRDIVVVLKDTFNTTLGPLPIHDSHVIRVPSNTLEKHSIGSHVANGVYNLIATLLLEKWEDDTHIPKMGTWESTRTPETSKFSFRGQNTLH
jgi:hypothetical protein